MEKRSDLGSSVYFSDKAFSINSQKTQRSRQKPQNYRIEIVNQDLEDAIKEVRTNVRENPEWRLNVQPVPSRHKSKQNPKVIVN